jgi:septum formation protein
MSGTSEWPDIILASQSPRRRQLLEQVGIPFTIQSADIEENFPEDLSPEKVPEYIAANKAAAIAHLYPNNIIIAADTVVILEGRIIGKPTDEADALNMLQALSGKQHEVVTGMVLQRNEKVQFFSETTEVYFHPLSAEQIHYYIHNYKPFDKAGAYAIQEWIGLVGIEKIRGDYYNVMGLPVQRLIQALQEFCETPITLFR